MIFFLDMALSVWDESMVPSETPRSKKRIVSPMKDIIQKNCLIGKWVGESMDITLNTILHIWGSPRRHLIHIGKGAPISETNIGYRLNRDWLRHHCHHLHHHLLHHLNHHRHELNLKCGWCRGMPKASPPTAPEPCNNVDGVKIMLLVHCSQSLFHWSAVQHSQPIFVTVMLTMLTTVWWQRC